MRNKISLSNKFNQELILIIKILYFCKENIPFSFLSLKYNLFLFYNDERKGNIKS
jgi:hypothetical protein